MKQRSAVGVLESAFAFRLGAGERALDVAEQFVFQDALAQPRAVEGHEAAFAPPAVVVDGAGDQFLAGSAFAHDQDRNIAGRHLPGRRHHALHRRVLADDSLESALLGELVAKDLVLLLQRRPLGRAIYLSPEMIQVQRLFDEAVRPVVHRLHGDRYVPVRRHQNHLRRGSEGLGLLQHLQTVTLPFHDQVGDDHIVILLLESSFGFGKAVRHLAAMSLPLKRFAHHLGMILFVVDDQNAGFGDLIVCHTRGHLTRTAGEA